MITEAACNFRADASNSWHTTYILLNSQFTLLKSTDKPVQLQATMEM